MTHLFQAQQGRARMLISCPDQPGVVAAISRFLHERGANIAQSDQHTTDPHGGLFFMRVEFDIDHLEEKRIQLESDFAEVAELFQMNWRIAYADKAKRLGIFVSKEDHCLLELLWQWRAGDLQADIVKVISNHPDLREDVERFGIPFYHVPVNRDNKSEAERQQIDLLEGSVDVIILARYMQILSPYFVERYPNQIINIHHSFLPAFVGANPYAKAYARGVKIIGATAHYVTEELDAGPIIEQDVQRVNHKEQVEDLKRIGRQIERVVLARAVQWHVEDRILVHGNKTVIFA